MIRKGIVVICVLLSMGCAWAWLKSSEKIDEDDTWRNNWAFLRWGEPWFLYQKTITSKDSLWIASQDDVEIKLTLGVQYGVVTMEYYREQKYWDQYWNSCYLTTPVTPSRPGKYRPPYFLYHNRDRNDPWKHIDVYGIVFPLWFIILVLMSYPVLAFYMGPVRRRRRRKKGLCVHCGYDLRGTSETGCPECGEGYSQSGDAGIGEDGI